MTVFLFADNAATTLAGPIAPTATSLNLAAGTGALFPNPATGQQFSLTLVQQGDPSNLEIVYCTSRSVDACTVVRGQEGTAPLAFSAGDFASNLLTAGTTAAFIQSPQLQQQATNYAVDTGSVNALAISLTPAPTSFSFLIGVPLRIKIANTNTGSSTLTVNGTYTATILNPGLGNALYAQQLNAGYISEIVYTGTAFELLGAITPGLASINVGALGNALTGNLPNPALAAGIAAGNIGGLSGVLTGTLPAPGMAAGAAAANIGTLGNVLAGTLPNPGFNAAGAGFQLTYVTAYSFIAKIPVNGTNFYIVMGQVAAPSSGSGPVSTNYTLTNSFVFPTNFMSVICNFLGNSPPATGNCSAQPDNAGAVTITVNAPVNSANGIVYLAFGY